MKLQVGDLTNYYLVFCGWEFVQQCASQRLKQHAWASQFTHLGAALVFPHQASFHTPISLLFPTIDPAWYASDFDYPGWSLSDLTDQCFSPPVAFWGDSYQLCSYMHLTTLLADSDSVSDHLPGAHTFLKQPHLCSWLRTNNSINTSAFILNNKVEMKRNFTLCASWGLVFMFGLKKSILDWFLCIYCYCQRINWWIFHLMSQVKRAPRHTVRRILIFSTSCCSAATLFIAIFC